MATTAAEEALEIGALELKKDVVNETITQTAPQVVEKIVSQPPDIAFWFLVGSFVTLVLYLLTSIIREYLKNRK